MSFTEYADKYGKIYHDIDIKDWSVAEMNRLGLHKVDEEW